jgi:integrase
VRSWALDRAYAVQLPRNSFSRATLLLGRGVHPKLVQHLLGHVSITMTLDRYSHWMPSMGRHAADGMDEALG